MRMLRGVRVLVTPVNRQSGAVEHELAQYLGQVQLRFSNPIHAATRAYTCRNAPEPFELHWNRDDVPGETLLGQFSGPPGAELMEKIVKALEEEGAVRLFIFNSDADLCFEEFLEPA